MEIWFSKANIMSIRKNRPGEVKKPYQHHHWWRYQFQPDWEAYIWILLVTEILKVPHYYRYQIVALLSPNFRKSPEEYRLEQADEG